MAETLARWRAGALDLPDFYLLTRGRGAARGSVGTGTSVCWDRPRRSGSSWPGGSLAMTLRRLPAGPWWPELDVILDGVDRLEHAGAVVGDRLVPAVPRPTGRARCRSGPVSGLGRIGA